MSHRKYAAPRRGSLAFLPRGRSRHIRGKIRSFPKDDINQPTHLTAFIGIKAGMTHVVRDVIRPGSRLHKKEVVEPVTIIETPPMVGVGVVGYKETASGYKTVTTAWAAMISNEMKRCYYKSWKASKPRKAFHKIDEKYPAEDMEKRMDKIKAESTVVRLIAHTQMSKLHLKQKKAHIIEIQINGGNIVQKVEYARTFFEKKIDIDKVFTEGEQIDTVSVSKGFGWEGVVHRYGSKLLQKKTHRGRRKVACIGPFIPRRVSWAVGRAGQRGYHHRTEVNKRIYRIGFPPEEGIDASGSTSFDLSKKGITPLGGFPHYGIIRNPFLMMKGSITGPAQRPITLRKALFKNTKKIAVEEINLKWIDTSSKFGHGRFQTPEERKKFLGKLKDHHKTEQNAE